VGSRVEAEVALLWDYESEWAVAGPCMPSAELDYVTVAHTVHRLLRERGVTCDVVHPDHDLSSYRVVVVPTLYLTSDAQAAAVEAAARAGAQVVISYFSGIATAEDHVRLGGYPGAFRDLLGVRVEEFFPLLAEESVGLVGPSGSEGSGRVWSEDARVTGDDVEVLRRYATGALAGRPAAARRTVGEGAAWYLGTLPDDATLAALLHDVTAAAGVAPAADVAPGVEVVRRRGRDGSWLFVLNHTEADCPVDVLGHDLVTGADVAPGHVVPARTAAVVRESGAG
jgi:beta-galactosidase